MQPFIQAIILTVVISAFIAAIFFILYAITVKGSDSPFRLYNLFKKRYGKYSREKRVKERMKEYKSISGVDRPSLLRSAIPFSIFLIVIFALLFKVVFFTAITSDSMRPTFEKGDLVLMQTIHTEPKEGDIIMFERPERMLPITHRVVSVTDEGVRTQGDARGRTDPWVISKSEIDAKAVKLGGKPIVLEDVGNYFILETREMRVGKYGSEYAFVKNVFSVIRTYGYALCVIAIAGYVILMLREARKY